MSDYCVEHPQNTYVVYAHGQEHARADTVRQAVKALRDPALSREGQGAADTSAFLWINLNGPSYEDIEEVAQVFDLHPLAFEDAIEAHQRPKFESYGSTTFMVLRPAALTPGEATPAARRSRRRITVPKRRRRQAGAPSAGRTPAAGTKNPGGTASAGKAPALKAAAGVPAAGTSAAKRNPAAQAGKPGGTVMSEIALGETHVFLGENFIVVINHAPLLDLQAIRAAALDDPQFRDYPQLTALHRILDRLVDNYLPIIRSLEDRADEIEDQVFTGTAVPSHQIYHLARNIMDIGRAVQPLDELIATARDYLQAISGPGEIHRALRDVADHARDITERTEQLRHQHRQLFSANSTLISEVQNEQMKKISGWAGIFFFPSVIAAIYGMNFHYMPELSWVFGYPMALGIMIAGCFIMYLIFKRQNWL